MTTNYIDKTGFIQSIVEKTLKAGATEADAVLFESAHISTSCRKGLPESLERAENMNLGLRVFVGHRQSLVSTSDLRQKTLDSIIERGVAMAQIAPEDPFLALAEREQMAEFIPDLDLYDAEEPSPEWLLENCKRAEDEALSQKGITNSEGAEFSYSANCVALVSSKGFAQTYLTSSFALSVSVLAGEGVDMQRDYDYSVSRHRADLTDPEVIGRKAAEKTLARLHPRNVASCQIPVIFDPKIAKGFVSTFAGAISGAAIARGTSFLKDKMGQAVFTQSVTIVDDPHIVRALGSRPFDAEGVRNGKRNLVENGVLQGWLLDLRSANKLGMRSTGDAARGVTSGPMPSSSNLYLAPGLLSPKELMADIKEGIYVTDTFGSGSNILTGDVSVGAAGFWIENGQITYPVNEFTLAGNLTEIFSNLTPANDLTLRFATNAPTIRVEGMVVAGIAS